MFSFNAEQYSTHEVILWPASGQFWMRFIELYGFCKAMVQPSQCIAKRGTRDILLSGWNWCYWSIMRGCIYGKKDLIGSRLLHGDSLVRLMTWKQASRRYSVSALYERNEKIYGLDYFTIGKSTKFWVGTKSFRVIEVDLRYIFGQRTRKRPSDRSMEMTPELPHRRSEFRSQGHLESPFEILINCMNTRSLALWKFFRYSRALPYGLRMGRKQKSRFSEALYSAFYSGGERLILSG